MFTVEHPLQDLTAPVLFSIHSESLAFLSDVHQAHSMLTEHLFQNPIFNRETLYSSLAVVEFPTLRFMPATVRLSMHLVQENLYAINRLIPFPAHFAM